MSEKRTAATTLDNNTAPEAQRARVAPDPAAADEAPFNSVGITIRAGGADVPKVLRIAFVGNDRVVTLDRAGEVCMRTLPLMSGEVVASRIAAANRACGVATGLAAAGNTIAVGHANGKVSLWDARSLRAVRVIDADLKCTLQVVKMSTDGTHVAVAGLRGAVLYQCATGVECWREEREAPEWISGLAMSADADTTLVFDRVTSATRVSMSGDARKPLSFPVYERSARMNGAGVSPANDAAFTVQGHVLTAWGLTPDPRSNYPGEITRRKWSVELPFPTSAAYSPSERWIAVAAKNEATGGGVVILNAATGQMRVLFTRDVFGASLAWSADGRRLASGWSDGAIRVDDVPEDFI